MILIVTSERFSTDLNHFIISASTSRLQLLCGVFFLDFYDFCRSCQTHNTLWVWKHASVCWCSCKCCKHQDTLWRYERKVVLVVYDKLFILFFLLLLSKPVPGELLQVFFSETRLEPARVVYTALDGPMRLCFVWIFISRCEFASVVLTNISPVWQWMQQVMLGGSLAAALVYFQEKLSAVSIHI